MWNRLDWYRKLMMGIIPISFSLLLYLLFANSADLLLSDWFISLVSVPAFVGSQVSGAGYIGRGIDAAKSTATTGKGERISTWIGLALGLAVGITLAVVSEVVPFAKPLGVAAEMLLALGSVSTLGGLGNRIGQCIDKKSRPANEKKFMGVAATLGLVAGIIFAAKCVAMVSVIGVTGFLTGGAALPIIGGLLLVMNCTSSCASSADYTSKAFNFLRASKTNDPEIKSTVKERFHEYRGSFAGVSTGLIVAGIVIGAILVSQPYLLAGFAGVVAGALIVSACVSVMGGLFSRIGRLIDAYKAKKATALSKPLLTESERQIANEVVAEPLNTLAKKKTSSPLKIAMQLSEASQVDSPRALPPRLTVDSDSPTSLTDDRDRVSLAALIHTPPSGVSFAAMVDTGATCSVEARVKEPAVNAAPQFSFV